MKRRSLFRILAILLAVSPLLVLEGVFRWAGWGETDAVQDPMITFSGRRPLFVGDAEAAVYRTAREHRLFFGDQSFAEQKPTGTYRVFCLGGSTVRGRPFETDTAFGKWMELELSARDPGRQYEAINCGGLSYASYRLRGILEEVLQYEPDLIVLATGHNEFLEDRTYAPIKHRSRWGRWVDNAAARSRLVTALRHSLKPDRAASETAESARSTLGEKVTTRLDSVSGYASYHRDPMWRANVIAHFGASVRAMVERCRSEEVPIVLLKLGSNLRDTPPFKSEHRAELAAADQQHWQAAFDQATSLDTNDPATALSLYQEAAAIDDRYALLSFRIARCLDRLDRDQDARNFYLQAKEDDICPLRMLTEMGNILQQIADDAEVPLVNADRLLEAASLGRTPGYDVYADHVHPGIRQHQQIAEATVAELRTVGFFAAASGWTAEQRQQTYQRHLQQLGPAYLTNGRERVQWLEGWARAHRLYFESLPVDAVDNLRRGIRHVGFAEMQEAWQDFAIALRDAPHLRGEIIELADDLHAQGRPAASDAVRTWLQTEESSVSDLPLSPVAPCLVNARWGGLWSETTSGGTEPL